MIFIKEVIDEWDPIELLFHAPKNEYWSEIEEIAVLLYVTDSINELSDGIHQIFLNSFGSDLFRKSKHECDEIASQLLMKKKSIL